MEIDLSFSQAAVVMPVEYSTLRFIVVGAGGTGSFIVPALARLIFELKQQQNKSAEMLIVDPDVVENGNIPRSNFCFAEVGRYKAQTLAERVATAWGIETSFSCEKFDPERHLKSSNSDYRSLTIIVGCVDNYLARRKMHLALDEFRGYGDASRLWWIDGGNGRSSGQVLLGSTTKRLKPEQYFTGTSICRALPAPSLQHSDLLEPERIETKSDVSCPERVSLGEQGLNVNQRVAIEIAEILSSMLLTRSLKRYAVYIDVESGTTRSTYITPTAVFGKSDRPCFDGKTNRRQTSCE
ncbi:MAG: ThiF family adenylyltransferase [Acidobacteria bacterium]|nr:ThiF family adenylyltransferase [Acidobacteriota bacterium]